MTIFRVSKDKNNPYVMINKAFLEDPNISLKLKGFLAYCLSKPDDWKFHIRQMSKVLKEGKDTLYAIVNEGIEHGYIERIENKKKGIFAGVDYLIHETKNQKIFTVSGNPDAVNSDTETPTLLNNKVLNNEKKREEASPLPPPSSSSFEVHKRVRIESSRYDQLVLDFGVDKVKEMMERLDEYADINPKRFKQYACHGAVIRKWIRDDQSKAKPYSAQKSAIEENKALAKKVEAKFPELINRHDLQMLQKGLLFAYGHVTDLIPYQESGFKDRVFLRLQKMNLPTNGL